MLEYLDQVDSLVGVFFEEFVDQILVLLRNLRLEGDLLTHLITCDCLLIASKGSISMNKLVEENSESPNIKLVVMLAMIDHFRSHVLKSTAKSVTLTLVSISIIIFINFTFASPAEITYF